MIGCAAEWRTAFRNKPLIVASFSSSVPEATEVAMLGASALVLVLTLAIGLRLVATSRGLLTSALLSSVVLGAGLVLLHLYLPARAIPVSWIRVLHEGGSSVLLEAIYSTTHTGLGFTALVDAYTPRGVLALRGAAHLNLCLTASCACLLFPIGHYVLRARLPALIFTAAYLANVQTLSVATSELPTVVLEVCFLCGVIGFEAVRCEQRIGRAWAALGQLLLGVTGVIAILCREESLIVVGPAVVLSVVLRNTPGKLDEFQSRLLGLGRRLLSLPGYVLICATVATLLVPSLVKGHLAWLIRAANPLDPGVVSYPFVLADLLPLGLVALILLGWAHCLHRSPHLGLAPLTLLCLFKLYEAAGHSALFELIRYTSALSTAVIWLALFGWRQLQEFAERWSWTQRWRTWALLGLCAISATNPPSIDRTLAGPINRDQQRAARFLMEAIEKNPTCTFVAKHVDREGNPPMYVFFGEQPPRAAAGDSGLDAALLEVSPKNECVLFYYGLDCNRLDSPCETEVRSRAATWRVSIPAAPYSSHEEHQANLTFATFPIRKRAEAH